MNALEPLKVIIAGATGKVGRELVKAFAVEPSVKLAGAVARTGQGQDVGEATGIGRIGVALAAKLEQVLLQHPADVLVDFTRAEAARDHITIALQHGCAPVVGTTGFTEEDYRRFEELVRKSGLGAAIIANFAIGVMLQMKFCEQAARLMPHVEVVEMHHNTKVDAPSGTALRIAARLEQAGANQPVPIHSLRLPGAVAHHEVIFGGPGQTLTIRHDSVSRESFVPGVLLAVKGVRAAGRIVHDLEDFIDL
ncbi:MAG: 4-hydroxy-tetrahydrodipicolinate reductase [Symbiobacteriia bacterium]